MSLGGRLALPLWLPASLIALGATLTLGGGFAHQAEVQSPALVKVLLFQIETILSAPDVAPIPVALQFLWLGPLGASEVLAFPALEGWLGTVDALTVMRTLQVGAYEIGAPFFALGALKRGATRATVTWLVVLYAVQPFALAKLSYDTVVPSAGLLGMSYLGWATRRRWLFGMPLIFAIQVHPVSMFGTLAWILYAHSGWPRERRFVRGIGAAIAVVGAVQLAGLILPPLIWSDQPTLAGMLVRHATEARLFSHGPAHGAWLILRNVGLMALLVGTAGARILARPSLLLLLVPDALYYVASPEGLDHGLIPATVGLLTIGSCEAAARVPRVAGERATAPAALILALVAAPLLDDRAVAAQLLGPDPPPPRRADIDRLAPLLRSSERCVAQPTLVAAVRAHCRDTEPLVWRNGRVPSLSGALVVIAPPRLRTDERAWAGGFDDVLRVERSVHARQQVAEAVGRGELGVVDQGVSHVVFGPRGEPLSDERVEALLSLDEGSR